MERRIGSLIKEEFDVLVIGGGITGACIAHDAALRGLKTALVEKDDFGMATSSASSKLLHGGIRYLQKLQLGKVRESARERIFFQKIAPQLTTTVPFLIPTYKGSLMKGRLALTAGMWIYHALCCGLNARLTDLSKKIPFGRFHSQKEIGEMAGILRNISGITGGQTLYEVHMDSSERMTLQFIKSAASRGAVVANHLAVTDFLLEEGRVTGVGCQDTLTGSKLTVRAKITVNAAGPFLPALNGRIPGVRLRKNTTGFSKGVHLVTRQVEKSYALALSSGKKTEGMVTRGGRHIFIIPWRGKSLIGTTNVPFTGLPDEVCVTEEDIVDFLADINGIIPDIGLCRSDVHYAFAGLYPLLSDEIKSDTYQGHGEYQLVDHAEEDGVEGIFSVFGAKYTTARVVAEKALDMIASRVGCAKKCRTSHTPLEGADIADFPALLQVSQKRYASILEPDAITHLVRFFGREIDTVVAWMQTGDGLLEKLCAEREILVGEVVWAVEKEMACTLDDVVIARTGLGTVGYPGREVLERIAAMMQNMLGWSDAEKCRQLDEVERRYTHILKDGRC